MRLLLDKAIITPYGIYFNSSFYSCKLVLREQLFDRIGYFVYPLVSVIYREGEKKMIWVIWNQKIYNAFEFLDLQTCSSTDIQNYIPKLNQYKRRLLRRRERVNKFIDNSED